MDRPDDEGDVVEVVNLVMMCDRLHCLPRPGGLLEQDARLMYLFQEVYKAQDERATLDRNRKGPQ